MQKVTAKTLRKHVKEIVRVNPGVKNLHGYLCEDDSGFYLSIPEWKRKYRVKEGDTINLHSGGPVSHYRNRKISPLHTYRIELEDQI